MTEVDGSLTVRELLGRTREFFESKGIGEGARLDAELLLAAALGIGRLELYTDHDRLVGGAELDRYRDMVRRRSAREPAAYILGSTGFCSLEMAVDARALIPRRETELLAEMAWTAALERGAGARVLELGTGCGAIACAVAHYAPEARVVATDVSEEALALAGQNAEALGVADRVALAEGDLYGALGDEKDGFDVIVSNPPYVTERDWPGLAPEIREFEPRGALVAGADGLDVIRGLAGGAPGRLAAGGVLMMEVGAGQSDAAKSICAEAGLGNVDVAKDYGGVERIVVARA